MKACYPKFLPERVPLYIAMMLQGGVREGDAVWPEHREKLLTLLLHYEPEYSKLLDPYAPLHALTTLNHNITQLCYQYVDWERRQRDRHP